MSESKTNPQSPLSGKVAVVTGGGSGIGRAVCLRLARAGALVAIVDYNAEAAESVKNELNASKKHNGLMSLTVDVRSESDTEKMAQQVVKAWERIDFLVHSAGILRVQDSGPRLLHQVSKEECDVVIDTNLKGTFLSNRAVLPVMIKQKSGHIVNVASTSGRIGRAFDSIYCASKFGVVGLSESLAEEMRQFGIKASVILPDAVDTPLWQQNGPIAAPEFSLPPDRVAGTIEYILALPADVILENIVIAPFRTRRRKKRVQANKSSESE